MGVIITILVIFVGLIIASALLMVIVAWVDANEDGLSDLYYSLVERFKKGKK